MIKPFVTELDLKLAMLPPVAIDYLKSTMPKVTVNGTGPNGEAALAYDFETWLDGVFV